MLLRQISQTKLALGGDTTLAVINDMPTADVERLFRRLWRQVFLFERRFSRFLPMSELSLFNRSSGLNNPISPEFRNLLIAAKQLGEKTNGLFNPFIIPALQNTGYLKSAVSGYEHDAQTDYTNRRVVSINHLVIGDNWASIPFGTAIDLGGCGKGYLADQLAKVLDKQQVQGYWMSIGGDVASKGRDENGKLLSIAIQDANNLTNTTKWVVGCPESYFSIATSGTFRRKNHNTDEQWHHIIDPSTLKPAVTNIKLATVCADTAMEADALASCAVIIGSKKAPEFLKECGVKSALLQCKNKISVDFDIMFGEHIKKEK